MTEVKDHLLCLVHYHVVSSSHDDVIKRKHFSALLAICAGNSPVTGEFPAQRPVARSFDVFFDLRQNNRLSKQSLVILDAIALIMTSL